MQKSESIAAISKALAKAQGEIANASKNSTNPHFRSSYADLAEVINTVRPVFAKHGITFLQAPASANGLVHVETMLLHESGEYLSSIVSAPIQKNDAQGVGSAITYCRRYGLSAMAGIAQEDDDGNAASGGSSSSRSSSKPPTKPKAPSKAQIETAIGSLLSAGSMAELKDAFTALPKNIQALPEVVAAKDNQKSVINTEAA